MMTVVKNAREFSVLGPLMGGFGSQAFLGIVHADGRIKPTVMVFLPDDIVESPEMFRRVWMETELARQIDHVNVIGVHGLAKLDEGYARVVEYADAESLRSVYRRAQTLKKPLTASVATSLVADACMGVHYAHDLGEAETGNPWVHGGIRPETLQVSFAGLAKVTGFGAQSLADSMRKRGATGLVSRDTYTSPEQVFGGRAAATVQSDIYALGCVLFEALTGKPPPSSDNDLAEMMFKDELARAPGVTDAMVRVVLRATQKKSRERYATALDMRMELLEQCEPSPEADIKRWLDELFPANAVPRATRIQMLHGALKSPPPTTGRLLVDIPVELQREHKERAAIPTDDQIEARIGEKVDDVPELADLDAIAEIAPPDDEEAARALLARLSARAPDAPASSSSFPSPAPTVATPPPSKAAPAPVAAAPAAAQPMRAAATPPTGVRGLDEVTEPRRARSAPPANAASPSLPPLPSSLPPLPPTPQVVYKTPTGLVLGLGLAAGAAIALVVVLVTQRQPVPVVLQAGAGAPTTPPPVVDPLATNPLPTTGTAGAPLPTSPTSPTTTSPPSPTSPSATPPGSVAPSTPGAPKAGAPTGVAAAPPRAPVPTGPGTLVVKSTPPMAISVDGKPVGTGEATVELPAGTHSVVGASASDGVTVKRSVKINAGQPSNLTLVAEKGSLAIEAPAGCDVFVDGKKMGTTPLDPIELYEGPHKVLVKKGSIPYSQNVPIVANRDMYLNVQFHDQ